MEVKGLSRQDVTIGRIRHLARSGLLTVAFVHPAALRKVVPPGGLSEMKRYLGEMYRCSKTDAGLHLPVVLPAEVVPGDVTFQVTRPSDVDGSMTLTEIASICHIVAALDPAKVVEIGSFQGLTTVNLARNALRGVVHTVDLPPSSSGMDTAFRNNDASIIERRKGYAYAGTEVEDRINQHYGDTATFDFEGVIGGGVDLLLIDAAHSYEYVRNDTIRALPLLREGAVILWHDYGRNDFLTNPGDAWGVTRFLHELADVGVSILQGTSLGVLRLDPGTRSQLNENLQNPTRRPRL